MSAARSLASLAAAAAVPVPADALRLATARVLPIVIWVVLPVSLLAGMIGVSIGEGTFALDFHNAYWPAGRSVLHASFAYDPRLLGGDPFVYPPLTAVLFAPIAGLPRVAAEGLYTAADIACVLVALRFLGVWDWRCYGVAFLWPPVLGAVHAGNVTLLLLAGVGLAWRVRARPLALGLTVALLVSVKLFLWPLALWLPASRRYRAAVWAACLFVVSNAAAWISVGAGSVVAYVHLLERLTHSEDRFG